MKKRMELLAPGGDIESIKAAILAGADSIYCGLVKFNARNRAANIGFDELNGIIALAHRHDCQVFLTLNIIMLERDMSELFGLLNKLSNTQIDGVIVQDLGLFHLLSKSFKRLDVHASTQCTTHNAGQVRFLKKLGVNRVNLSRELDIDEIAALTRVAREHDISTEVFVHGSYCISFSGICYISSVHGANSANRGRCSQPCRDRYETTAEDKEFPLNLKDNSAFFDARKLADAGVGAVKIEGRMKSFYYVYTTTNTWRKQLDGLYEHDRLGTDDSDLHRAFNRDFSNSYLTGEISKSMFIDNPRHHSTEHYRQSGGTTSLVTSEELHREIATIKTDVQARIDQLSIAKQPLSIGVSGDLGAPLKVSVTTPTTSFTVQSDACLTAKSKESAPDRLTAEVFLEKFKLVNDTEYHIAALKLEGLQPGLHLSFAELTRIRDGLLFALNGSREWAKPVEVPAPRKGLASRIEPTVSVLISSIDDAHLFKETSADVYFQVPSDVRTNFDALVDFFTDNDRITPWFPSILIGEEFTAATEFMRRVKPRRVVTDNTGIAYEAHNDAIPWIAGPHLNIANSISLDCLRDTFNCRGSFLSNELSQEQLKRITPPDNFDLFYCIYRPILLLTTRQCLFHQVSGCGKTELDDDCMSECERTSSITNMKGVTFLVEKSKGNYPSLYNEADFLNTDIVEDFPGMFSSYFVDLRSIETETHKEIDKIGIIHAIDDIVRRKEGAAQALRQRVHPTTDISYRKGM